jgi:SH3 domain-containing protein
MSNKLLSAILISIGLFAWPASALADVGYTTGNVNLRTGPGTDYAPVGTLSEGTRINVLGVSAELVPRCKSRRPWMAFANTRVVIQRSVVIRPSIVVRPPYGYDHGPHPKPNRPRPNCKIAPGFPCR